MGLQTEKRSDRQWLPWPSSLVAVHVALVGTMIFIAATWCVRDDTGNVPCLERLSPIIDFIVAAGREVAPYAIPRQLILPVGAGLVLIYLLLRRAATTERAADQDPHRQDGTHAVYVEALGLVLFTLLAVLYRFYLLNRIPSDSIAEVHFVYLASSDWQSLFRNNAGEGAPLGLIHYLMAGGLWQWFGATMLTPRFAAAITSVVVMQTIYWLGRTLGGPATGFLAAAFYTFSPVEMAWSRHDMFPFNNPSLLVVPLAAFTYLAVTRLRPRDWIATALLMGASRHLFASGLPAFLAPVGTVLWIGLFDRKQLKRFRWMPVLLPLGIALWAVGRSLAKYAGSESWQWFNPYSSGLSSRGLTRDGGGLSAFRILGFNIEEIFRGLFLGGFEIDHQTPMGAFAPLPWIPPLVAILFVVGLVWCALNRRNARAAVLVPLLAVTILPALVSIPDAHRMAAAFPAICALGALVLATAIAELEARWPTAGKATALAVPLAVILTMGSIAGAKYFRQTPGEPPPNTLARALRPFLSADMLLVLDVPDGLAIEEYYLLYDDLLRQHIAVVVPGRDGQNHWPDVASNPKVLLNDAYYRETALRHQVPDLVGAHWKRIVFILHEAMDRDSKLRLLRDTYENVRVTNVSPATWRPGYDFTAVEIQTAARIETEHDPRKHETTP